MLSYFSDMNRFAQLIVFLGMLFATIFLLLTVYFYFKNKTSIFKYEKEAKGFKLKIKFYTKLKKDNVFKALDNFLLIYGSMPGEKSDIDLNNKIVKFLSKLDITILSMEVNQL